MLVIFDCDGVLVDSEQLAARVFAHTLQSVGVNYSAKQCMNDFVGLTLEACFEQLRIRGEVLPRDFPQLLLANEALVFERELRAVDGVSTVLDGLQRAAIAYCVASNGGLAKVRRSLKLTGLSGYFDQNIYSSQMVPRGKPFPDLFLFAAESMGVPRAFCRVVEDSAVGVEAAVAAGMSVYCYGDTTLPSNLEPTHRLAEMTELISLLGL